MAIDTSKNSYTIIFSIVMVVIVGSLLAGISSSLSDKIKTNKKIEKMQNILFAMGVTHPDNANESVPESEAEKLFEKYVGDEQYIIVGADATKTNEAFKIEVKKEQDKVKADPSYKQQLSLFIGKKDGKSFYIVPVRGNGLWGPVWAYMSLDKDMVVQGAYFDHQTETPGLGANIKEAFFRDDFKGEHLFDAQGNYQGIAIKKGNLDPKNERKTDNAVDAMAGATITGDGVAVMIKKGLALYIPYFETLKTKS
ncbi:NADH:ubiquinone reductase (Na(+)-transporting) subunit C [Aquimarina rhabdastrellae]